MAFTATSGVPPSIGVTVGTATGLDGGANGGSVVVVVAGRRGSVVDEATVVGGAPGPLLPAHAPTTAAATAAAMAPRARAWARVVTTFVSADHVQGGAVTGP